MDRETLTTTKNEILAQLHKDVFLTPKGMLKLVQLVIVICAFAMTTNASGTSTLTINRGDGGNGKPLYDISAKTHTSYPFNKYTFQQTIVLPDGVTSNLSNRTDTDKLFKDGFRSESQFYVFVGVISFFYVVIAAVCYGWFKKFSEMNDLFAANFTKVDFIVTVLLTLFWFLAVTLWSAGFSALRSDAGVPYEFSNLVDAVVNDSSADGSKLCPGPQFDCVSTDSWSKLYGSIIFGYLCIFLLVVNCWYCFKDTEWHMEPEKLGGILRIRTETAPSPAGLDDVNLESGRGDDSATIQPGSI